MPSFKYFNPVRQVIGVDALMEVSLKKTVSKALIVVSEGMTERRFEALHKVTRFCEQRSITPIIYDEVEKVVTKNVVSKGAQMFQDFQCEVVIGVGGGKTMDAAKLIGLLASQKDMRVIKDWLGPNKLMSVENKTCPVLLVPTTLNITSALSNHAFIQNPNDERAIKLTHDALFATYLIADPTYLASLDSKQKNIQRLALFIEAFEILRLEHAPYETIHAVEALRIMQNAAEDDAMWMQSALLLAQTMHERIPLITYLTEAFQSLHPSLPYGLVLPDLVLPYYTVLAEKGLLDEAVERMLKPLGKDIIGLSLDGLINRFLQTIEVMSNLYKDDARDLRMYGIDEAHISDYIHLLKDMIPSSVILSDDELYTLLEAMMV